MSKPFEIKHHRRIIALILLVTVIFIFAVMRIFEFQLVNGSDYLNSAEKSSFSKITVTAARGEIVDRNGVPITKNKAIFNVEFDYVFLKQGTENEIIYNLIKLFEKQNEEWIDELPITKTQPYEFIESQTLNIARMKKKIEVNDYTTAQDCLDNMYIDFKLVKFVDKKGNCTHCGEKFEECDFKGYDEETNRKIAGIRYQMLQKDFSRNNRVTIAEDISPQSVIIIKEFSTDYSGVQVVERAKRTYISGETASHLIGSMGPIYAEEYPYYKSKDYLMNDIVGKNGIEMAFEDELRGKNGTMLVTQDSQGNIVDIKEEVAPVAGKTVKLTIDIKFQEEVQRLLAEYIENYNKTNRDKKISEAASVVVLDVKTGGVLACVSYPYYDINDYSTNYNELATRKDQPLFNRALKGVYRPGSTFKPVVAVAGLLENKVTPTSTITCTGYYRYFSDYQPGCLQIGHRVGSNLNVSQALNHSCNIFFYDTGRVLGIDSINKYASLMGLGADTGIELGSEKGRLSSPEYSKELGKRWEGGDVIQAAIGQLDTGVTPLQMAVEAMTLANRGTRYNVHIVDQILSNDMKEVISTTTPTVASSFEITSEAFDAISGGMILAGRGVGAPNQLTDLGYDVAIKTGTPEAGEIKTNNGFIAFAPVDNPEIAISCIVENGFNTNQFLRRVLVAYEEAKKNWAD